MVRAFYLLLFLATVLAGPALAVLRPEMVQQFSPEERRWFRNQVIPGGPGKGNSCCSAVIHEPNRHGAPAVWYRSEDGVPLIRCYAPGGGA